jgi:hypothetical protein
VSTATGVSRRRASLTAFTAARAIAAAVLAIVVTFSADHTPAFGLVVLGCFGIVQGLIVAAGSPSTAVTTTGRALVLARAAVLVVLGGLALALREGGLGTLLLLETVLFLAAGALEVVSGLRRADASVVSRDLVTVGGLELVVGAMLLILGPDSIFAVGVLGAWGAVVAVYLGIAAVSIARREGEVR